MLKSLHSKLLFYFVILSLLSIFLMSIAFRLSFDECFTIYLDNKREDEIENFTNTLSNLYSKKGKFDGKILADAKELQTLLSYQGMTEGLFYEVYSFNGVKMLDSTNLMDHVMGMTINDDEKKNILKELGFISETRPFIIDGTELGAITLHYKLGYKKGEFQFKERLNKYIFAAEITMILIALLVSFFFSKKLTYGLRQVSEIAKKLRNNLNVRIPFKGLSEEMMEVAVSINELAESLSHQEHLRKQFSTDMAHEFRTPISTLRSQIEAFQDGIWEPTPERLDKCHSELMRLVRLVDEQEQLMAVENPKLQLNIKPLSLSKEITDIKDAYLPIFQKKNISLLMKEMPIADLFLADRDRFKQIISNVLNNCYKYTSDNGQVIISAAEKDGAIQIKISDNGVGISKEDLPFIFERFYRGDKSRDRKTGGIGIGLSIVKALTLAQGASIAVESEVNKGTTVILCFQKYTED